MKTNLNEIAKEFHESAVRKGFWEEKREIGTLLMLIVSELSEALEAHRKDRMANLTDKQKGALDGWTLDEDFKGRFYLQVKDTFEDEIADTFIRLFDLCGSLGIDIDWHIQQKMRYNATREYKHGKRY
jgi:NTP pyrophosphatase (non-canonical NTP hydrolase)